jgi:hypothetical protein
MRRIVLSVLLLGLFVSSRADAQQRPLVTEDPETVGSGLVLIEAGIDLQRDMLLPASGLTGNLLRLPSLGVSFGAGSIVEIQVDGGLYNRFNVTDRDPAPLAFLLDFDGDDTTSIEDLVIGTKVRLLSEAPGRPALGVRFATKLPIASVESGLGLGTTDFHTSLLLGKTVQSIRIVGNGGLSFLTDPTLGLEHNSVMTYGLSLARAVAQGVEIVGEVNGRLDVSEGEPPPGTDTRGAIRAGLRFTRSTVRIDGGVIIGMTPRDPSIGFTGGFTWVFRGFTIP